MINYLNGGLMEDHQKQLEHFKAVANEYMHKSKGYEQLLKHISIGIREGFVYDLKKIKALIDLRIGK